MKKFKLLGILLLAGTLYSQEINLHLDKIEPNYGLAVTGTGMTLCMIGTTMNQTSYPQHNPRYGTSYANHNNDNRAFRLTALAVGAFITLTGIIIQNKNRKNG